MEIKSLIEMRFYGNGDKRLALSWKWVNPRDFGKLRRAEGI